MLARNSRSADADAPRKAAISTICPNEKSLSATWATRLTEPTNAVVRTGDASSTGDVMSFPTVGVATRRARASSERPYDTAVAVELRCAALPS